MTSVSGLYGLDGQQELVEGNGPGLFGKRHGDGQQSMEDITIQSMRQRCVQGDQDAGLQRLNGLQQRSRRYRSATRLVKVCCGVSAIATPTVLTMSVAQASTLETDGSSSDPVTPAASVPEPRIAADAADMEAVPPAVQPVVDAPAAPAFATVAEEMAVDAAVVPEPIGEIDLESPVADTPTLEVTAEAPNQVVPDKLIKAPVSAGAEPGFESTALRPVPVAAVQVVFPSPTSAGAAPEPVMRRADAEVLPSLDDPTPTVESAAVTPTVATGTATDLNAGEPYTVSWNTQPQFSPSQLAPSYDLELSAAQLTVEETPNVDPPSDLDGALDRLGLQWEGVRTDVEVAELEIDYGAGRRQQTGIAKTTRYMANAYYDLPTGSTVRPYLGVGVGYANIAIRPDSQAVERTENTRFAYQLRTGVQYEVAPRVMLNLGYRYFSVPGQVQMGNQPQGISSSAIEVGVQARF